MRLKMTFENSSAYSVSNVRWQEVPNSRIWDWKQRPLPELGNGRRKCTPCLKNVPPLACYNFDACEWILIFFGRNVTDKVGSALPGKTRKQKITYFTQLDCLCYTQCTCALSSWKKKLSSLMCLIASDIYWGSNISHWCCPSTFTPGLTKNNSHLLHSDWQRDRLG